MLLLRLSGLLLLRFATRQLTGLLLKLPPRNTRLSPSCTWPDPFGQLAAKGK